MINKDRIVSVTKQDLLSIYGTMLKIAGISAAILAADDVEGNFTVPAAGGAHLANQPVKKLDFGDATAATVYFVADYFFGGFAIDGADVTATGAVINDAATLYLATLASGAVTVTAITPVIGD